MSRHLPRRQFLQAGAFAAAGLANPKAVLLDAQQAPSGGAPKQIRFGMIGVRMQGSGLLATSISLPGVERAGAADLYDGRHALAKEITGNPNYSTVRGASPSNLAISGQVIPCATNSTTCSRWSYRESSKR
jgi:hypothetical protein